MQTVRLGRQGAEVSIIGLACRALSERGGATEEENAIATLHAAAGAGVTLFDTGDFHGMGHNEMLLREALWSMRRDRSFVAVSFGAQHSPGGALLGVDYRPASVKNYLAYSLRRLGTDYVDLYQPAGSDPAVPIEDTIGAVADLVQVGYVRYVGLPESSPQTIRRAHAVHPITAVQARYSLFDRGIERQILPTLRELGIGLLARGILPGGPHEGELPEDDPRLDRLRDGGRPVRNPALEVVLREIADQKDTTPAALAVAWVLAQGDDIVSLIEPAQLPEALGAQAVELSSVEHARIERAVRDGIATAERCRSACRAVHDEAPRAMG